MQTGYSRLLSHLIILLPAFNAGIVWTVLPSKCLIPIHALEWPYPGSRRNERDRAERCTSPVRRGHKDHSAHSRERRWRASRSKTQRNPHTDRPVHCQDRSQKRRLAEDVARYGGNSSGRPYREAQTSRPGRNPADSNRQCPRLAGHTRTRRSRRSDCFHSFRHVSKSQEYEE